MRADQRIESMRHLHVFALAADRAVLGKKSFLDHVGKQLRVGPVGRAQQIVEALRGRAVLVGELLLRHRHARRRQVALVLIRAAQDQPARFVLLEPQQDVGRELVGGVLFPAEQGNFQNCEYGMTAFVQKHIQERADHRVDRCNAGRSGLFGRVLPDLVEVFVTDRDAFFV